MTPEQRARVEQEIATCLVAQEAFPLAESNRLLADALTACLAALDAADGLRAERDEARADCKSFWKLRAELAERQRDRLREALPTVEQLRAIEWDVNGECLNVACPGLAAGPTPHYADCWIAKLLALLTPTQTPEAPRG